jgi:putative ABC transport system permease protein
VGKLFGIPVGTLAVVLVAVLALVLGGIAGLALRNRVFLRLGVRNARRRPGRSALIVVGLMLGTTIITAALATGDTMSQTIRSSALTALGRTDEVVAAQGVSAELATGTGGTESRYFPEGYAALVTAAGRGAISAATPVIVEPVAVQDLTSRQTEPRMTLFAAAPGSAYALGAIRAGGSTVSLAALRPGEIYLNAAGAEKLGAKAGDSLRVLTGSSTRTFRVRAVVRYQGGATDGSGLLLPLSTAQRLLHQPGLVRAIMVVNREGVSQTDAVVARLKPAVTPLDLEVDKTKQDALEAADTMGASFMSLFTTFGSFSIAAGILLIFLIFVMLASERRGELGIARAVGTRRRHLVQMFVYEGVAYDLIAAAVGALVGVAVAEGMVMVIASAFGSTTDLHITYAVKPASIVLAYSLGVLLTFAVVSFSAWRVSRMNIVTAIRNLPEPPVKHEHRRRRLLLAIAGLAFGGLLIVSGVRAKDAVPLGLGVSFLILSAVPLLRSLGVPERATHTGAGLALVAWFVLPLSRWLFGAMKVNFSIFVLGGLMIVIGATWTIMYNADILLGVVGSTLGRVKSLAPVLRMAMAYPLRGLFRTGVTLAMFTLVVFTLVVGATTTGSFVHAVDNVSVFGGGFDVRATTSPAAPIVNMRQAIARAPGLRATDFRLVSSESTLPIKVRQLGTTAKEESYIVNGADPVFLIHTTYGLATHARGYSSAAAVWRAVCDHPGLAVVDPYVVPRKANWGTPVTKFRLSGFYIEDKTFAPVRIVVRDPQTGTRVKLTVIGVLPDSAPQMMAGIWTSQRSLGAFVDRVLPTTQLFVLRAGVDPKATAAKLESAFLANGMQADSMKKLLADAVGASLTFDRLIMGFMGLGLIVGVAALGVITARAVVERRQQIGVLRAIGFRRGMVQLSFIIESSFIALTSIVVGTGLGLAVAYNVIGDSRSTPSWEHMAFTVPWFTLSAIFVAVYAVALVTTLVPAARASRIYPAEALRYQ